MKVCANCKYYNDKEQVCKIPIWKDGMLYEQCCTGRDQSCQMFEKREDE